jgi:hypothetical protein
LHTTPKQQHTSVPQIQQIASLPASPEVFSGNSRPVKRRRFNTDMPTTNPPPKRLHNLPNEVRENIFEALVNKVGIAEAYTKYRGVCCGFKVLIEQEILQFQPTEKFLRRGDGTAKRILKKNFGVHLDSRVKSGKYDTVAERLVLSVKNKILSMSSNKWTDELQL